MASDVEISNLSTTGRRPLRRLISSATTNIFLGHDPKSGPYRPDMRKDEENITLEDRQEAKRRIEGSLASETDGFDMK